MKHTDKRLTAVLEALEDGVYVIKPDYSIKYMNSAMIKAFGDGIGRKCHDVFYQRDKICPWCQAAEVFEDGNTVRKEEYRPTVDKTYDIIALPLRNRDETVSKLTIYRDITLRKKQAEKLRATEEDYKRLFEHAACGVFISTKEGKFVDANRALLDMLGYDRKEDFLKIDIANDLYVRPEDRKKFREMIQENGKVVDYEVNFKRKDKTPIPILLTGHARYDGEGNIIGYEGINVDQSQLKKTQLQLFQAEKMTSLGKLAAGVAHQLNNPLGGIILYTKLILEDYDLEEPAREDLLRILKDAQRCRDTVKELLEFTRQTRQLMRPHNINEGISRTLFLLENQTLFHNIEINKELGASLPFIQADVQQLYHLLMNIILNAAEAMEGHGTLSVRSYCLLKKDRVVIEISDTGPGIAEKDLPHLFEPFFTTKEEGKGTGLGLSLVYGIVENHGGTITARNKPDTGVTFTIEFPICADSGDSEHE